MNEVKSSLCDSHNYSVFGLQVMSTPVLRSIPIRRILRTDESSSSSRMPRMTEVREYYRYDVQSTLYLTRGYTSFGAKPYVEGIFQGSSQAENSSEKIISSLTI